MPDINFGDTFMANADENPVHKIIVEVRNKAVPTRADVMQSKEGTFIAVPVEYDPSKSHAYKFAGPNQKKLLEEFGENFISVTQLGSLIEGIDDTSAINKVNQILKSVGIKKKITGEIESITEDMMGSIEKEVKRVSPEAGKEIENVFRRIKNFRAADVYGNAFHRAIELLEKEGSSGDVKDIEKVIRRMSREKKSSEKYGDVLSDSSSGDRSKSMLLKDIDAYFKKKAELGLGNIVGAEQQLGAVVKIGNEIVKIAGTFDQLFLKTNYILRDLKTSSSKQPSPAYGLQLNLLEKLLNSVGISVSEKGITRVKRGQAFDYNIGKIKDRDIISLISMALDIQREKDPVSRELIQKQARELLGGGSVRTRIGRSGRQTTYNDMTIRDIEHIGYLTEDQKIGIVKNIFDGMSAKDKESFVASLFNMNLYDKSGTPKPGNSFYYKGSFYDRLRQEIPNPYFSNTMSGFGYKEFETEQGETAGGAIYGGLFASQNAQKYRILKSKYGEAAASAFLDQMLKDIDAAIGNREDYETAIAAESFLRSVGAVEDKTSLNKEFVTKIDQLSSNYRNISWFLNNEILKDTGGQLQGISKEEQRSRAKSSSEYRGVKQNEQVFENLRALREIAEGSGGFFDTIKNMESDLEKASDQQEVMDKYSESLRSFFSEFMAFKDLIFQSIRNIGNVSEIDEFGNYLDENQSQKILDYIDEFYANVENVIKNSKLSFGIQRDLMNQLSRARTTERDGSISHQIGYRIARGVGAYDYINEVLSGGFEQANIAAKSKGIELSPEQYASFVLSPEAYSQYSLSKKFKESYQNKKSLPQFLMDFVGDTSYTASAEFASLQKQIIEEFVNSTTQAFEDTRIYTDKSGNLVSGLRIVSDILGSQLSNQAGEFDLSREFMTFEKNPMWAQRILRGMGIYRVEDIDEKAESAPQFKGAFFPEVSEDREEKILSRIKELQAKIQNLGTLDDDFETIGNMFDDYSNEMEKLQTELESIRSLKQAREDLISKFREYLDEQNKTYDQAIQTIEENYKSVGNISGTETHPEDFETPEEKRDYFLETARENLLKRTGGMTSEISDENLIEKLMTDTDIILGKDVYNALIKYKEAEGGIGTLSGYSAEQVSMVRNMLDAAKVGYEYQQRELDQIKKSQEEAEKAQRENEEKIKEIKERAEISKKEYETASAEIVELDDSLKSISIEQEKKSKRGDAAKKGWETRRKKQNNVLDSAPYNAPTNISPQGVQGEPVHVIVDGTEGGDFTNKKKVAEMWDSEGRLISYVTKEINRKTSDKPRGTPQLDVIKQIKEDTGKIVDIASENSSAGGNVKGGRESGYGERPDKKQNSLLSDYLKLLNEEYLIKTKIAELDHTRRQRETRGESIVGVSQDIEVYRRALKTAQKRMKDERFSEIKDSEQVRAARLIREQKLSSKKELLSVGDAEESLKAFEKYAQRRLRLQEEIYQAQLKSNTSIGREKEAWKNVVSLKQQELSQTNKRYELLKNQAEQYSPTRVSEIESDISGAYATNIAQRLASGKGNKNIADVIKSDIQRVVMRVSDFSVVAKTLNQIRKTFDTIWKNIKDLNSAMTNLRIVVGSNEKQANAAMAQYNDLAKEIGSTTAEVAKSGAEWLRQGYSMNETLDLIKSSVYLSKLGFMDMSSSISSLTSVMKGFNVEAKDSMEIVSVLTKLDQNLAVSAGGIAEAMSQTSAVAQSAGLSMEETAAAVGVIIDKTQAGASQVGNALKTILARFGNVKAGAFVSLMGDESDIGETNSAINDTEKVLGAIGIKVRSSANDMRDFNDVMDELAEKWQTLSDVEKNAVATALGGTRQRNFLQTWLSNYSEYKKSLEEAENAIGSAEAKYAAQMESLAFQFERISTAWEEFTQKLEASGAVIAVFKKISDLVSNIGGVLQVISSFVVGISSFKIPAFAMKLVDFFTGAKGPGRMLFDAEARQNAQEEEVRKYTEEKQNNELIKSNTRLTDATEHLADVIESKDSGFQRKGNDSEVVPTGKGYDKTKTRGIAEGTIDGRRVYQTESGEWRYYNNRKVNPADVGKIESRDNQYISDSGIQDDKTEKASGSEPKGLKSKKLFIRADALRVGATGISAGLMAGLTKEGDTTDKVATAVTTGATTALISAIPFVGPILGPLFGPWLGDILSSKVILPLLKADEYARKERVQQAKDNLEAIKGISTSVTGLIDIRKKGDYTLWDAEDWKQVNNYVDSINKAAAKSESFSEAIGGAITNIEKMTEAQLANIEAARIEYEARQTYAAGEQDRYTLQQQILENQKKLNDADEKVVSQARAAIKSATAELKEYTDALNKSMLESAFYSSGVSSMRSSEISGAALERVIMEIAREWESKGVGNVFYGSGQITSTAYSDILSFIRQQSGYESLLKNESRDIFEVKQSLALFGGSEEAVKRLQELAKNKNLDSLKEALEEFGYTSEQLSNNTVLNNIIDKIFNADTNSIATVAHGIGMTIEEFEEANRDGSFDWLTSGDILNGADKFLEKMTGISEIFKDLAEDSKLSAENIKKVASSYKFLLRGESGKMSTDNILSNIGKMLSQGVDSEAGRAYIGMKQMELMQDSDIWKIFVQDETVTGNLDENIKKQLVAAKSYSEVVDIMSENAELYEKFWSFAGGFVEEFDLYDEIRKTLIEYQTNVYDNEISNLQSIKDSLSDINKQREREIELIKAKETLENASKKKKRAYRAGVGFIYTSDQEAIKSAQDKVDELETQQKQDDIQYQIDTLEQQKSILENIENNKQLGALQETVKDIFKKQTKDGENIVAAILASADDNTKEEFYRLAGNKEAMEKLVKEREGAEKNKAQKAYDDAYDSYRQSFLGNNKIEPGDVRYDAYHEQRKAAEANLSKLGTNVVNAGGDENPYLSGEKAVKPIDDKSFGLTTVNIATQRKTKDILALGNIADKGTVNKEFGNKELAAEYSVFEPKDGNYIFKKNIDAEGKGMSHSDILNALEDGEVMILNRTGSKWDFGVYKMNNELYALGDDSSGHIDFGSNTLGYYLHGASASSGGGSLGDDAIKAWVEPAVKTFGKTAFFDALYSANLAGWGQWVADKIQNELNNYQFPGNASGTLSFSGGPSLINENGLESIITPDGTITSLPAKTGIVPADLTRNLWALGEVAPNLIARLGGSNLQTNNANSSTDNSINIQNLDATFNTQEGFDGARFIQDLRSRIILTRNNH